MNSKFHLSSPSPAIYAAVNSYLEGTDDGSELDALLDRVRLDNAELDAWLAEAEKADCLLFPVVGEDVITLERLV